MGHYDPGNLCSQQIAQNIPWGGEHLMLGIHRIGWIPIELTNTCFRFEIVLSAGTFSAGAAVSTRFTVGATCWN